MITVRFPTGLSIRYNEANYVIRGASFADLYDRKDGNWIAQVPFECVIEIRGPCRVYTAVHEPGEALDAVLDDVAKRRSSIPVYKVADLKRALEAFDARRRVWK